MPVTDNADLDPRDLAKDTASAADELTTLLAFLRYQRDTLQVKCAGLDVDGLARRSVEPSTLSLIGLVRHLADVERSWFRCVMAGLQMPALFSSPTQRDGAFDGVAPEAALVEEAWSAWHAETAFTDAFVQGAVDLDVAGHDAYHESVSLRWVLMHMVEEYARHNGHADLLRQRIDGVVGQ